jgi:hypothetical protein
VSGEAIYTQVHFFLVRITGLIKHLHNGGNLPHVGDLRFFDGQGFALGQSLLIYLLASTPRQSLRFNDLGLLST